METREQREPKPPWESPRIVTVGHVTEIIRGGGGKLSLSGGDPGYSRKPPGGGELAARLTRNPRGLSGDGHCANRNGAGTQLARQKPIISPEPDNRPRRCRRGE